MNVKTEVYKRSANPKHLKMANPLSAGSAIFGVLSTAEVGQMPAYIAVPELAAGDGGAGGSAAEKKIRLKPKDKLVLSGEEQQAVE